jgi:predicted O-methyltransferase YrrM
MKSNEPEIDPSGFSVDGIEKFVIESGSDNVGIFGGKYEGGIHCQQIPDEIAPCIFAILESGEPITSYLEIGVAAGGTAFLINHFFKPDRIVLLDDKRHHKVGLRPNILMNTVYEEIAGRSDSEEAIAEAEKRSPYDLILIDGDHGYPGVKLDTVAYLPMLCPGGFLALHDSAMAEWGVARVVRELKADPKMEFIGEYKTQKNTRPLGVALFRKAA